MKTDNNPSEIPILQKAVIEDYLCSRMKETDEKKNETVMRAEKRSLLRLMELLPEDKRLTTENLASVRERYRERGLSKSTEYNFAAVINRFCRWLGRPELCYERGHSKDIAGQTFGNLLAVRIVGKNNSRQNVWLCRCLCCGRETEYPASVLTSGAVISCGCQKIVRLQSANMYVDNTILRNVLSSTVSKNNTSGVRGVFLKRGRWTATIQYKKRSYYLGSYDNLEEAAAARREAETLVRDNARELLATYLAGIEHDRPKPPLAAEA